MSLPELPWGWIAALAVLGLWMLGAYNRIVRLRGAVVSAWQQMDAVIRGRQQALGALLDAVMEPMAAERPALDALVAAQVQVATAAEVLRKRPSREEPAHVLSRAEATLIAAQARLLALVDHHTELRRSDPVAAQLKALAELAPRGHFARQAFNDAVQAYNAAIEEFPTRLLNRFFRFERAGTL